MRRWILPLVVLTLLASPSAAQPEEGSRLRLEAERVVVFKDGYALVMKHGTAHAGDTGVVFTDEVPDAAVLGTLWALAGEGSGRLLSTSAGRARSRVVDKASREAAGFPDVLAWNKEASVRLELGDGSSVSGTVREVLGAAGREIVVLQTTAGEVVLPVASVRRVDGASLVLTKEEASVREVETKRMEFRFDGAGPKGLHLLYLSPGLRWIPTYRLGIPPQGARGQASLSLQAEILNEVEDVGAAALHLVVGVPNFRFREVVSPFSLEPMLRNALLQAAPQLMGQSAATSNLFRARGGEWHGEAGETSGAMHVPEEIVAGSTQDLFVYELPPTRLPKGHRIAVPIFDAEVPVRHVHTWHVNVARRADLVTPQAASPLQVSTEQVWHQVELRNVTSVPWTTGAALSLQDGRPLGQDLLAYTSRGASVRVPVTVAVDVRGTYREEEVGRQANALRLSNTTYTRIDGRARIEVTNHKAHPIDLEVTLRVGGHVDEASEGGEVRIESFRAEDWPNYRGHPAANVSSAVRFSFTLAPGERAERVIASHWFVPQ